MAVYMIIIVLGILLAAVGLRHILLCREIKHTQKQLEEIALDLNQNRILRQETSLRELETLTEVMNGMLKDIRRQRAADHKREAEFQQQIAQISHDLRTPLTSMIGYLCMLDQSGLSQEEKEDLAVIERKAQALQRLISQFYDYSKARDEDLKLELTCVDATRLLREKMLEQWKELEERNLEVELEIPEDTVMATANLDALERIYANLLQNCSRYAKTRLRVSLQKESQQVKIIFGNDTMDFSLPEGENGAELEKLFERFYVKDTARTQGASGLGLSIARGLTEKMGGQLNARMPREGWLEFELVLKRELNLIF
ncbi:MAG: sensor histidine kinase [Marvinbryantia sp.]|jgi:signal transduction histidine kinase